MIRVWCLHAWKKLDLILCEWRRMRRREVIETSRQVRIGNGAGGFTTHHYIIILIISQIIPSILLCLHSSQLHIQEEI